MNGKLFQSDFAKHLAALVSATVIAQAISFGFNVLLARLYTPEEFGTLSVFLSVAGLITVFACFKYDVALVAAKTDEDAQRLLALGFRVLSIVTIITGALVGINFLLGDRGLYAGQEIANWLPWMPLTVLLLTAGQLLWMWNVRVKRFRRIAWVRISEAVTNGGGAAALFMIGAWGLLAGTLASQLVAAALLFFIVARAGEWKPGGFSRGELKETMRSYAAFPKINIIQGFVDIFQLSVIVLFAQHVYGDGVAGFYGQCMRVLQVPMRLIVMPVSHVYFAEASERFRKGGDLYSLSRKTALRTLLFALPVTLALLFAGPWLFALVFGGDWREAGVYAQLLSVWILFDLVRAPLQQVASIVGRQSIVLLVTVTGCLLLLGVLFAAWQLSWPARWLFMGVGISQAAMALVLVLLSLRLSRTAPTTT